MIEYTVLWFTAFGAGLSDAVVGGGGLIQLPALFSALPTLDSAIVSGTNKLSSVFGTGVAAVSYSRRVNIDWKVAAPASIAALVMAFLGAYTLTIVPSEFARKIVPFILIAVAIYTFVKKDLGRNSTPRIQDFKAQVAAVCIGGCIGFYDGFFGPGTGSFLVFLFVRFFGMDFLNASAVSKVVNVACNVSALILFAGKECILWKLGLSMAVFNIAGSLIGSRIAIRYGSAFVRKIFLAVVTLLILKLVYDGFLITKH